jgi:superfamily I DNA/RNA helicase
MAPSTFGSTTSTVAILAQGTSWADAFTQALLSLRLPVLVLDPSDADAELDVVG